MLKKASLLVLAILLVSSPSFAGMKEGQAFKEAKNYTAALKEFEPLAEAGDAEAMYELGMMYKNGNGVDVNDKKAVELIKKSSSLGNVDAKAELSGLYIVGEKIEQNYKEAMKLSLEAAQKGNANAMNNIGALYQFGLDVKKNIPEAIKWYKKAADKGSAQAQYNLGKIYVAEGKFQNKEEAFKMFNLANRNGHPSAIEEADKIHPRFNEIEICQTVFFANHCDLNTQKVYNSYLKFLVRNYSDFDRIGIQAAFKGCMQGTDEAYQYAKPKLDCVAAKKNLKNVLYYLDNATK